MKCNCQLLTSIVPLNDTQKVSSVFFKSLYTFICIVQITAGEEQNPALLQSVSQPAPRGKKPNTSIIAVSVVAISGKVILKCNVVKLPPTQLRSGSETSVNKCRRAEHPSSSPPSSSSSLHGNLLMILW